jgi:hypothetical protein
LSLRLWLWVALSALFALAGGLVVGHLSPVVSAASLTLGGLGAWWLAESPTEQKINCNITWHWLLILVIGVGGFFQFLYLIFEIEGRYAVGNPNNLGDMALHIGYIRSLARGLAFWPQNIECAGEVLKYPFGMDLWNALFESLGVPLRAHLVLTGLVSFVLLLRALYQRGRSWALAAFFFSGGFAGWHGLIQGEGWKPGTSVDWKNLFLAVFVTQRGFLFALPVGLWLLGVMDEDPKSWSKKRFFSVALLWGALAFFHLHSFLFLSLYLGLRVILRSQLRQRLGLFYLVILLALPFVYQSVLSGENSGKALGWLWGWTFDSRRSETDFLVYLIRNFGVNLMLIPLLLWVSLRHSWVRRLEIALLVSLALFFFNFKVAPWPWDGIKVLLWAYLILHFEFYHLIISKLSQSGKFLIAALFFYPGVFQWASSFPARQPPSKFSSSVAQSECRFSKIKPNDVIVSSSEFDHPLYFQGGLMAMGFEGHLWSHGYDIAKRKRLVERVLLRDHEWQLAAKELDAKWLFWGQNERSQYLKNWESSPRTESAKPVIPAISDCGVLIYDLSQAHQVPQVPSGNGSNSFDRSSPSY